MPKLRNRRKEAALRREASKRSNTVPAIATIDPSMLADPTYHPSAAEADGKSSSPEPSISNQNHVANAAEKREAANKKRKLTRENADILPERPSKVSRTTAWRNATGKTKKGRMQGMQRSVASFFTKILSVCNNTQIQDPRKEEEEESGNSDVEIVSLPRLETKEPAYTTAIDQIMEIDTDGELNEVYSFNPTTIEVDNDVTSLGEFADNSSEFELEDHASELKDSDIELDPYASHRCESGEDSGDARSSESECPNDSDLAISELDDVASESESESESPQSPTTSNLSDEQNTERDVHQRLRKLIQKHRTHLQKKKTLNADDSAAAKLFDLEALDQYNDERYALQNSRRDLKAQIESSKRAVKHQLKLRLSKIQPAANASKSVAGRCGRGPYFQRTIRSTAHHLFKTGLLPENQQGKGAQHETLLSRPEVHSALQQWVKGTLPFEEGGFNGRMRPIKLCRYVNEFLLPDLKIQQTISESTAVRWLKKLGFSLSWVKKGVYVDGHERPDVVASRTEFLNYLYTQVLPFACTYDGPDMVETQPTLEGDQKIHYPIFHDETCVHANDLDNFVWMREGEQPLRSKSCGRIVHISDFILEACGRLYLNEEEIANQMKLPPRPSPPGIPAPSTTPENQPTTKKRGKAIPKPKNTKKGATEGRTFTEQDQEWIPPPPPPPFDSYRLSSFDARRIIYPGSNYDPWWDMRQLIAQTKDAIEIFNAKFPDGIAVFIFDCSSAHEAFSADALLAHKMNCGPGGKQPMMRDTVVPLTGEPQSMVFPSDYQGTTKDGESLAGKPKGMERILLERGLLAGLEQKHNNKVVGVCGGCKKSQAAREAALKEAREKQDEIEGSGVAGMNDRGISDIDDTDLSRPKDCCMQRVLSLQQDFREEKPLLQLIIEKAGHKCIFLPKFHCELNPIEMVWGQTKQRFRGLADGTFKTAQRLVPECLDAVSILSIRKFFRHCWRYMDAYSKGLNIKQAAYAVKKYTSHRRIPAQIVMDVNILLRGANG